MKLVLAFLFISLTARADDVETAVKRFYVDMEALAIRGTIDGDRVDRCREVLAANYNEAFVAARRELQAWRDAAKRDPVFRNRNPKLPLREGPLFTSVYEGGAFTKIESFSIAGDRAYAKVRIQMRPIYGGHDWADLVILHRVSGRWLIDDILSRVDDDRPESMRDRLVIPPIKKTEPQR